MKSFEYRKISTLNKWFKMKDIDVDEMWRKIDEIIIKTILAAYPILKHSYHTCFPTHDKTYACFELLGFDVLLDWKLKPYLLEVTIVHYKYICTRRQSIFIRGRGNKYVIG